MGLLIDTSIIVQIERAEEQLDEFLVSLGEEDVAIASITASELLVGVLRATPESRRARREAFVENVRKTLAVLPVNLMVARTHARLLIELQATGSTIGLHDLLIAATAVGNGHAILTHNEHEFGHVRDLEIRLTTR